MVPPWLEEVFIAQADDPIFLIIEYILGNNSDTLGLSQDDDVPNSGRHVRSVAKVSVARLWGKKSNSPSSRGSR